MSEEAVTTKPKTPLAHLGSRHRYNALELDGRVRFHDDDVEERSVDELLYGKAAGLLLRLSRLVDFLLGNRRLGKSTRVRALAVS